jgi:hypothetical protein
MKYIESHRPLLFFVSESEVTKDHLIGQLNIDGYTLEVSKTLNLKGKSRLVAFVKNNENVVRVEDFENDGNEIMVYKFFQHIHSFIHFVYYSCISI